MAQVRFARAEEENDVLDLIDFVFSQAARPHDFQRLIPKVYAHPGFSALHAVAVEEGRLAGTVAKLPLRLRLGERELRAGYIGSVAVHPRFRGRGLMRELMAFQERDALAREYDLLILGGQRQRYQHFGFENVGGCAVFSFTQRGARHALPGESAFSLEEVAGPDHPALDFMRALHERQASFCQRPRNRFYDTLRTYQGVPWALAGPGGEYAGYMICMGDRVSELALAREEDLPHALSAWMRGRKSGQVVCPLWDKSRLSALSALSDNYTVGDEEMVKVLSWQRVLSAALSFRAERGDMPDGAWTVEIENAGRWRLESRQGSALATPARDAPEDALTQRQAVSLLFSPLSALLPGRGTLRAWLPLALHVPTADQF